MTSDRRHALVIASQNDEMGHLDQLDGAARDLDVVLRDSEIGACAPGLRDGESLLAGQLTAETIRAGILEAIGYAGEKRATLVLALLGHGFSPENNPALYYMGWRSRNGVPLEAVDVRALLSGAADHPGVRSVIAIIDTCTAAAGIPANIAAGTQNGKTGLALLMAAPVGRPAYDLGMSRELTGLLRAGLPGDDATLRLEVIGRRVQAALDAQDLRGFSYPGDLHAGPMWLARNRQADSALKAGSYGDAALAAALRPLAGHRPLPASLSELRGLHAELSAQLHQQRTAAEPGLTVVDLGRAVRVTDSLIAAHRAAALLREHLPDALDDISLRRALVIASGSLDAVKARSPLSVTDAVELAALNFPFRREPDSRPQLARLVVALAAGAEIDPGRRDLKDEWAASVGPVEAYNDALRERKENPVSRRFRLVVSYDALAGEWPLGVRAWVLYAGRECGKNDEITCTADQPGAEAALVAAVSWAEEEAAALGEGLGRIEIAMPATRLLDWQPEMVRYNGARLGLNYTVVLRWSRRLERTQEMRGYNGNVRKRLADLPRQPKSSRVHWLGPHEVSDQRTLSDHLAMGRYAPASGLMARPRQDTEQDAALVDLLLRYLPIVLWPQGPSLGVAHRRRVAIRWQWLPDDFLTAYRARWAGQDEKKPDLIADIRAVWDDDEWLRFCGTASA
jgi:hypothetical protein